MKRHACGRYAASTMNNITNALPQSAMDQSERVMIGTFERIPGLGTMEIDNCRSRHRERLSCTCAWAGEWRPIIPAPTARDAQINAAIANPRR